MQLSDKAFMYVQVGILAGATTLGALLGGVYAPMRGDPSASKQLAAPTSQDRTRNAFVFGLAGALAGAIAAHLNYGRRRAYYGFYVPSMLEGLDA